jgi:hypothetical protein
MNKRSLAGVQGSGHYIEECQHILPSLDMLERLKYMLLNIFKK